MHRPQHLSLLIMFLSTASWTIWHCRTLQHYHADTKSKEKGDRHHTSSSNLSAATLAAITTRVDVRRAPLWQAIRKVFNGGFSKWSWITVCAGVPVCLGTYCHRYCSIFLDVSCILGSKVRVKTGHTSFMQKRPSTYIDSLTSTIIHCHGLLHWSLATKACTYV